MSMLFAYMAGEEGGGLEVLKWFVRGGRFFFFLLCVCVWGGGWRGDGAGGQVQYSPCVKKIADRPPPSPPINK